jgi:hypothetical protein
LSRALLLGSILNLEFTTEFQDKAGNSTIKFPGSESRELALPQILTDSSRIDIIATGTIYSFFA